MSQLVEIILVTSMEQWKLLTYRGLSGKRNISAAAELVSRGLEA
jgi:hypothetical protein